MVILMYMNQHKFTALPPSGIGVAIIGLMILLVLGIMLYDKYQ